ncbi:Peroxiredoxin [Zhouia amylolytica]|uniref:Peroxiredoxin n=1 Tax=Zhouia amylolytica TaxID=376730 RepID=A0A1I6RT51_9FLAO|nr:TlpA disulfide reductase family protein [Zhouia amylolytica]SFS67903.1 Peroxiredoxin [Zhouia amylolytica]
MRLYICILLTVLSLLFSCKNDTHTSKLPLVSYRGSIEAQDEKNIQFIFKVTDEQSLKVYNADEIITVDEITYEKDTVIIKMPVFESVIKAVVNKDSSLTGFYIKPNLNRIVPFIASPNEDRFEINSKANENISGNWKVKFSPNDHEETNAAKGIFEQNGNRVTGTIRTTTGDYRYLEGVINNNQLQLSTFDGAHAYLFTATVTDSTMSGNFYSGNHYKEPFTAKRNESFELANADTLTHLKEGYDKLAFSFPDANGNMISLGDDRFKNKVVVVQIMGTWCPNCLDETRYYSEYYKANKDKDLEFIGLAFEYVKSDTLAFKAINRLKDRVNVEYPILLAQYGTTSKEKAQEKLPMLNHVLSYPTSIFIDKKGKVRKIHTGFNGPATGDKYKSFQQEFTTFLDQLLNEE